MAISVPSDSNVEQVVATTQSKFLRQYMIVKTCLYCLKKYGMQKASHG